VAHLEWVVRLEASLEEDLLEAWEGHLVVQEDLLEVWVAHPVESPVPARLQVRLERSQQQALSHDDQGLARPRLHCQLSLHRRSKCEGDSQGWKCACSGVEALNSRALHIRHTLETVVTWRLSIYLLYDN